MKKLLWIGDANCDSGFAKATHYTLETLRKHYEVGVLGLNHPGDPHKYPYPIWPCISAAGGDLFGVRRIPDVFREFRPDVVVIQNDPWNIPAYTNAINELKDVPRPTLVGAIAIDGQNCRGAAMNGLDHVIFWTNFAKLEAIAGGFKKPSSVVPLGVDGRIYTPGHRGEARQRLGLPKEMRNAFIVGNVNRNQPRKRLDLTIQGFANWIKSKNILDAYLYLHIAPTGDLGYDCDQLAGWWGLHEPMRIAIATPAVFKGATEAHMADTYRAFDVQVNTGVGEGWGLTTLEGMACGIPQVVGDWAALGEWAKPAARMLPCRPVASINKVNVIGGEVDPADVAASLDALYRDYHLREKHIQAGLSLAGQRCYNWDNIGVAFMKALSQADKEY